MPRHIVHTICVECSLAIMIDFNEISHTTVQLLKSLREARLVVFSSSVVDKVFAAFIQIDRIVTDSFIAMPSEPVDKLDGEVILEVAINEVYISYLLTASHLEGAFKQACIAEYCMRADKSTGLVGDFNRHLFHVAYFARCC